MFLPHTALHAAAAGVSISPQMVVADHPQPFQHLLTGQTGQTSTAGVVIQLKSL